jgi:hypothetical protein
LNALVKGDRTAAVKTTSLAFFEVLVGFVSFLQNMSSGKLLAYTVLMLVALLVKWPRMLERRCVDMAMDGEKKTGLWLVGVRLRAKSSCFYAVESVIGEPRFTSVTRTPCALASEGLMDKMANANIER